MARLKEELREKSASALEQTKRHHDELAAMRSKNTAHIAAMDQFRNEIGELKEDARRVSDLKRMNATNVNYQLKKVKVLQDLNAQLNTIIATIQNDRIKSLQSIHTKLGDTTEDNIQDILEETMPSLQGTIEDICNDMQFEVEEYQYAKLPVFDAVNEIKETDAKCTATIRTNDTPSKYDIVHGQESMLDNAQLETATDESKIMSLVSYGYGFMSKRFPKAWGLAIQYGLLVTQLDRVFGVEECGAKFISFRVVAFIASLVALVYWSFRERRSSQSTISAVVKGFCLHWFVLFALVSVASIDCYSCLWGEDVASAFVLMLVLVAVVWIIVDKLDLIRKYKERKHKTYDSEVIINSEMSRNGRMIEKKYPFELDGGRYIVRIEHNALDIDMVYLCPLLDDLEKQFETQNEDGVICFAAKDGEYCNKVIIEMRVPLDDTQYTDLIRILFCTPMRVYQIGNSYGVEKTRFIRAEVFQPPSKSFALAQMIFNYSDDKLMALECVFGTKGDAVGYMLLVKEFAMDKDVKELTKHIRTSISLNDIEEEQLRGRERARRGHT
eukprot:764617_1